MELLSGAIVLGAGLALGAALLAYLSARRRRDDQDTAALRRAEELSLDIPPSLHPVIDPDVCIGSLACVDACPEGDILGLVSGKAALVNASACIGHGRCAAECPVGAIQLVFGTSKRGVDLPEVDGHFETSRPGVHIVGELGGMGLIKNAITQGLQVAAELGERVARAARGDGVVLGEAASASAGTPCEVCHRTEGWQDVRFAAHDQTAFPLRGAHATVPCSACHTGGDARVAFYACTSCHTDPHAGELGARCEGCHGASSWETELDALAHQRTRFPLIGRHAVLPCQECHPTSRRGFAAAPAECLACHDRELAETGARGVDHRALGFGTNCQSCHDSWRWSPARYPAHDTCFVLGTGPHAGVGCTGCHTAIPPGGVSGACASGTATCASCHEHRCSAMDGEHRDVPGYQCRDRKCYECHRFNK